MYNIVHLLCFMTVILSLLFLFLLNECKCDINGFIMNGGTVVHNNYVNLFYASVLDLRTLIEFLFVFLM